MVFAAKQIIGSRVVTQSNDFLGKVCDFDVDTGTKTIVQLHVRGEFLDRLKDPLVILSGQIVEIKKDEIVVKDALIPEKSVSQVSPGYDSSGA